MLELSRYTVTATTILVAVALLAHAVVLFSAHSRRRPATQRVPATVGGGVPDGPAASAEPEPAHTEGASRGLGWFGSRLAEVGLLALTVGLVMRTVATGHAPFANQYEFAVSFAWGMLAAHVYFELRYHVRSLALVVLPIALAMLLYADTVDAEATPLVPALQNHLLLTVHVITAVLSYGAFAVGFGAAVLYLLRQRVSWRFLPGQDLMDEIGYRSTVIGFPLLTLMLILGAVWAEIAWGSYWSWDPKETAALVTWLVYGAYLHARVARDWRGTRAAWLLILGFAAILFTYFGNLFLGGLHSYA
jgi:cytochrome c-type biogenesis protein CcsB